MELHLKITGAVMVTLAVMHGAFPKRFNWRDEMANLSLMNRQLMYVHTFFIALMVLLNGVLCLYASRELAETNLGRIVCTGFAIFWGIRLLFQFAVYSSKLWRGKQFETAVHVLFSLLWLYFTAVFLATALRC